MVRESAKLGRLARYVRDLRVPLEMCPTSNVHSGAARSIEEHPIGLLSDLRFRVTVNTDNRLMSDITMSEEFAKLVDAFDWGWDEIRWATINGMKSAFMPFDQRLHLINERHQALVRGPPPDVVKDAGKETGAGRVALLVHVRRADRSNRPSGHFSSAYRRFLSKRSSPRPPVTQTACRARRRS